MAKAELSPSAELKLLTIAKKSRHGFASFYEYFFPIIYGYVHLRTNFNHELTEDLVSDIFIRILEKLDKIKGDKERGIKPYLFTMCRHLIFDYYKKQHSVSLEPEKAASLAIDHDDEKMMESLISQEEQRVVKNLVKDLSSKEQEIISLRFGAGLKNIEIALQLGLSESNVGVIIHRSIEKLKQSLVNIYENGS